MIALKQSEIRTLLGVLKSKGYRIYSKPYELNIVGRRTDNTKANSFDDYIYIFYKQK